MLKARLLHDPVVQRPVVLKLQRAQGMRHALKGILQRVGKVIHRVDAPFVTRIVMCHVGDAVDYGISHVHVRGSHVDLRAQHPASVGELPVFHPLKEVQIFFHAAVPPGTVFPRLRQRAAVRADLLGREVADEGFSLFDQGDGRFIHSVKVVRGKVQAVFPVRAEPGHIGLDRIHEFRALFGGIGVVKAKVKTAVILLRGPVV